MSANGHIANRLDWSGSEQKVTGSDQQFNLQRAWPQSAVGDQAVPYQCRNDHVTGAALSIRHGYAGVRKCRC